MGSEPIRKKLYREDQDAYDNMFYPYLLVIPIHTKTLYYCGTCYNECIKEVTKSYFSIILFKKINIHVLEEQWYSDISSGFL